MPARDHFAFVYTGFRPFALFAIALMAAAPARAAGTLEPFCGLGYGSTLYRLEMTFPLTAPDSVVLNGKGLGQSELEYPLDAMLVGFRYRQEFAGIGLRLGAWTNATAPIGKMQDSDWMGERSSSGLSTTSVLFKFSYTQSRAEMRWLGGEAGADIAGGMFLGKPLRYGLSVRAEHLNYRLFGAEGWHRMPGEAQQDVAFASDTLVLTYRLTRVMPRLFSELRLAESSAILFTVGLSAGPAFAWDHDDHVLRHKYSDTYAFGFEAGGTAGMELRVSPHMALAAGLELAYFRSKGKMDQFFYGDDPGSDEDETGTGYKGIVTRIIGLGGGATLGARYLF